MPVMVCSRWSASSLEKPKNRLPVQIVYQLNGDKNIPLGLVRADRFQLRTAYDKPMIKQSALLSA